MGFVHGTAEDSNEWTILTIGHLSVNKYWGETERVRAPLCTCSVLQTPSGLVLVDPSLGVGEMESLLHDQAGIRIGDIRFVFLTHFHGDHRFGLEAFPQARWLMSQEEIEHAQRTGGDAEARLLGRIEPCSEEPFPGVKALLTPGHTPGTTSLLFTWRQKKVGIVGDTVMTPRHFALRDGHSNSIDFEAVKASQDLLARHAEIIVPGHANYFCAD